MKSLLALVFLMVGASSADAALVQRSIQCDSNNYKQNTCAIDLFDARLERVNQTSRTTCDERTNYSVDRNYIYVSGGCRANFVFTGRTQYVLPTDTVLRGGGGGPGWGGGGGHGGGMQDQTITCESEAGRDASCGTSLRNIQIIGVRQISKYSPCISNQTYWARGSTIYVVKGCRAVFTVRGY